MGEGIDAAKKMGGEAAKHIDNMKDQLIIALVKRLADEKGELKMPIAEVDDTGRYMLSMEVVDKGFIFTLGEKQ